MTEWLNSMATSVFGKREKEHTYSGYDPSKPMGHGHMATDGPQKQYHGYDYDSSSGQYTKRNLNHSELKDRVKDYTMRRFQLEEMIEQMGGEDKMTGEHDREDFIDRRVRVVQVIKDPKFPLIGGPGDVDLQEVYEQRGDELQDILAQESFQKESIPETETVYQMGAPFMVAHPNYKKEEDVWERRLALRSLEEALRGDVSKPMPRPVVFAEDYENYREGRYVKDDCPIA